MHESYTFSIGFKFWKVASRKIYAVRDVEVMGGKKRKKLSCDVSDSDDEFEPPLKKVTLSHISSEIKGIRKQIDAVFQVTRSMTIPPGLIQRLKESFTCHICQNVIVPPVIFARCCKRIIGCQVCIDQWYQGVEGTNRSCPFCRFERAFAETTVLRGLDEFLEVIAPLLDNRDMSPPDDQEQRDSN